LDVYAARCHLQTGQGTEASLPHEFLV